jgi:hypothetical protein
LKWLFVCLKGSNMTFPKFTGHKLGVLMTTWTSKEIQPSFMQTHSLRDLFINYDIFQQYLWILKAALFVWKNYVPAAGSELGTFKSFEFYHPTSLPTELICLNEQMTFASNFIIWVDHFMHITYSKSSWIT